MNRKKLVAIILGILISIPTMVEGSSVILGKVMNQVVLIWLVYYNVLTAAFSLVVVYLIYKGNKKAVLFSKVILFSHLSVLGILLIILATSSEVAIKSIGAMTLRSLIWLIITLLFK